MGGHQGSEYRLIMAGIGVLCVVGAAAGIWPVVDLIASSVAAALLAAAAVAGCVAVVRRELRIRRRLAAIQPTEPHDAGPHAGQGLAVAQHLGGERR